MRSSFPLLLVTAAIAAAAAGVAVGSDSSEGGAVAPSRSATDDRAVVEEEPRRSMAAPGPADDGPDVLGSDDQSRAPVPRGGPDRGPRGAQPQLPVTTSPEGWTVAGGGSADDVAGGGPTVRWTLEVDPATGLDVAEVLARAETALYDPRSWARDHELVRVDDPAAATVRVVVAEPSTVDALCARAGLVTNGIFSCWNGRVAALNRMRWNEADPEIPDLAVYRTYLVNHEVGHGLGYDHRDCGGAGQRAHVMQQQTRTLAGCTANPWPHPDG